MEHLSFLPQDIKLLLKLNDDILGAVMAAAFRYCFEGKEPVFDDNLASFAFENIRKVLDVKQARSKAKFAAKANKTNK